MKKCIENIKCWTENWAEQIKGFSSNLLSVSVYENLNSSNFIPQKKTTHHWIG